MIQTAFIQASSFLCLGHISAFNYNVHFIVTFSYGIRMYGYQNLHIIRMPFLKKRLTHMCYNDDVLEQHQSSVVSNIVKENFFYIRPDMSGSIDRSKLSSRKTKKDLVLTHMHVVVIMCGSDISIIQQIILPSS